MNVEHALLAGIHKVLKPQELLVCEFGAKGNIAAVEKGFAEACGEYGFDYAPKSNFPTTEHFGKLLEANGFIIDKLYDYDRPTVLKDGD